MGQVVKFHRFPNLTYRRAQEEAYQNNWVIANYRDLSEALDNLNYEPFVVGWISGGLLACPLKTASSTLKPGINAGTIQWQMPPRSPYYEVYPTKGINEGFFYVEGRPRIEADKPAPGTYITEEFVGGGKKVYSPEEWQVESRRRDILKTPFPGRVRAFNYDSFNIMIDGWNPVHPERQLLETAAKALLQNEGKPFEERAINLVSLEVRVDPVRRFQFAPFMLAELFKALASTRPTPAQKRYQERFNHFTSCKKWLYFNKVLEDWKTHTNASDAKIQRMSDGSYKPPTLSVWKEVMHNRPSKKGFLAMDIANMYLTPKGSKLLAELLAPTYVKEYPEIDDRMNLKSIGGNLKDVLQAGIGGSVFAIIMVGSWAFLKAHVQLTARNQALSAARATAFNNAATEAELERAMQAQIRAFNSMGGVEIGEGGIEVAQVAGSGLAEVSEAVVEEVFYDVAVISAQFETNPVIIEQALSFSEKVARNIAILKNIKLTEKIVESLFARFPVIKSASQFIQKFFAATAFKSLSTFLSVFGIAVTSAQILGEELADIVSSTNYDEELRKASDWKVDNVSEYLNPTSPISDKEMDGRKANVFQDLLYYTISLPGERGLISFRYPELETEFGKKKGIFGKQYWDVKFFKVYDQPFDHVKKMAESRNMRLATLDEVFQAFFYLGLTGKRGVIDSGEFIFPLQQTLQINPMEFVQAGLNKGLTGNNDGFYYVAVKPQVGVVNEPLAALPTDRKDHEIVKIENIHLSSSLRRGNGSEVVLGGSEGDQWKIIYSGYSISPGRVRIEHVKSGHFLMSVSNDGDKTRHLKLGHPDEMIGLSKGNYGNWSLEKHPENEVYVSMKDEFGFFMNTENGILQMSKINPAAISSAWTV